MYEISIITAEIWNESIAIIPFRFTRAIALANALVGLFTRAIDRPRKYVILPPTANRLEKLIIVVFNTDVGSI